MIVEKSNQELRDDRASDYFQNIHETVRQPLVILDSDLRVQGVSRSFYRAFSVTKEVTEGRRAGVFCCLANRNRKTKMSRFDCRIKERAANAFSKWCNGFLTNRQARGDGTVNSSEASVL